MNANLPPVLLAEDEDSDATILRIAFKRARIPHPLIVVRDGQDAVDYLAGKPPFHDRETHPLPILLLLDLKMPRLNGFDVLAWLADQAELQHLPAVVLSSSWYDRDVLNARKLGARDYLVKPLQLSEYVKTVQELGARWLTTPPSSNLTGSV